jgi:hypothetical protein
MGRPFVPKAKLGWVDEFDEFTWSPQDGPNRRAADGLVEVLRSLHHVEDVDGAQVVAFCMLAESVDNDPTNAGLWGQYRAAEIQLRGLTDRGKESDFDSLLRELGSADLPDAKVVEPGDARGAGREGVDGVGATVDAAPAARGGRHRGAVT